MDCTRRWLEADQPRLLRMDGEPIAGKALGQDFTEALGVGLILTPDDEVIGIADRPLRARLHLVLIPLIQHIHADRHRTHGCIARPV